MAKASMERVSEREVAELNDAMSLFDTILMQEEEMQEERKNEKKEEEEENRIFATYTNTRPLRSYW